MTDPQKQSELLDNINNIITQQNKKLLEEISKLQNNNFEKLAKFNTENKVIDLEKITSILEKLTVLENAVSGTKKTIKSTTAKTPAAETGTEEKAAPANAPAPVKIPSNKMTYFKNRMLVDNDYYNNIVKQVDNILKGKSQEIENSPAIVGKKPNERKKAICQQYWLLISPGKELKPILESIEKDYKDLKIASTTEIKQPVSAQLDKDKQSDEE